MMKLSGFVAVVLCLVFSPTPQHASAAEKTIAELLGQEILGPQQALVEVQDYTEARVKKMPEAKTVGDWQALADKMRKETLRRVVFRGEAAIWRDAKTKVEWLDTIEAGSGYRIRKLRYESIPGLWIPALLYEPEKLSGKVPVMLHVNGHDRKDGKATAYKQQRCIHLAKQGIISINPEWIGMGQLQSDGFNHYKLNQLDLCGTSGVSLHYLGMSRAIDILLDHKHADPKRVGVAGLSGGGWQTIFISSLDTRVTLANPVAGYSSFVTRARFFQDLGDSEQTPVDLGAVADYKQLTAMLAPRAALLTFNGNDNCCFKADHALPPLLEAASPIYKLYGQEKRLRSHVNTDPGTHNFQRDNREALYRLIADNFFAGSKEFQVTEGDVKKELLSRKELDVEIPEERIDFQSLAVMLAKELPHDKKIPTTNLAVWKKERRGALADVVKFKQFKVSAKQAGQQKQGDLTTTAWRLKLGSDWTLPAVELTQGKPEKTALVIADGGIKEQHALVKKLLAEGNRVVAVDPFYFGASKIQSHDFLFALLVSAVGDRPLGIQAGQVAAVAQWLKSDLKSGPVSVVSVGPRTSLIALVAGALETSSIDALAVQDSLGSLKEMIEEDWVPNKTPEMFCFGLLEQFDIKQIAALCAPRKIEYLKTSTQSNTQVRQSTSK